MIFLFTGVPGASKTINAIKFINEDNQFAGRPIYYHNIREVKKSNEKGVEVLRENWNLLDNEQALKWYELPKGSVVVFDECQDIFPVNTSRKGAPAESLSLFAKHRHYGIDIFLITQEPRNVDAFVRRLVGLHRHHARHFGTQKIKIHEWQNRCCEDVHDWHQKQESLVTQSSIDSKYFGVYHSAEVHTHKSRLPWMKLSLICFAFLLIPTLVYYAWSSISDIDTITNDAEIHASNSPYSSEIGSLGSQRDNSDNWLLQHKPRIAGLDFTAPIYDSVREVKEYPVPSCIYNHNRDVCSCYTQQATKMNVPRDTCMHIIKDGFFDYSRQPDRIQQRLKQPAARRGDSSASKI